MLNEFLFCETEWKVLYIRDHKRLSNKNFIFFLCFIFVSLIKKPKLLFFLLDILEIYGSPLKMKN